MKYKLVIFDWDGTLMDSVGRIVSAMQAAAREADQQIPTSVAVKNIIGLSLDKAISELFENADTAQQKVLLDHYKDQYVNHDKTPTPLFDGATELLTGLKSSGYKLAVATGKGRQGLQRVWAMSGTEDFFDNSRCADEAQSKPSPDMLHQLLSEMNIAVDEAVMIGDSQFDMAMAKAAGMDRIGVSFGVHNAQQLQAHEPLVVIDQLSQLRSWL